MHTTRAPFTWSSVMCCANPESTVRGVPRRGRSSRRTACPTPGAASRRGSRRRAPPTSSRRRRGRRPARRPCPCRRRRLAFSFASLLRRLVVAAAAARRRLLGFGFSDDFSAFGLAAPPPFRPSPAARRRRAACRAPAAGWRRAAADERVELTERGGVRRAAPFIRARMASAFSSHALEDDGLSPSNRGISGSGRKTTWPATAPEFEDVDAGRARRRCTSRQPRQLR